jgi:hypothetical protein
VESFYCGHRNTNCKDDFHTKTSSDKGTAPDSPSSPHTAALADHFAAPYSGASPDSSSSPDTAPLTDHFAAPHSRASPRFADSYPNGDGHGDPNANCDSGMFARFVDAGCASNDRPLRRFHR